jgi:hypothetical protein
MDTVTPLYSIRLNASLGLVPETGRLLELWQPGMTAPGLLKSARDSGAFSSVSTRRLRNIVVEAFAPRFLINDAQPAQFLKAVQGRIGPPTSAICFSVYTCRAKRSRSITCSVDFPYEVRQNRTGLAPIKNSATIAPIGRYASAIWEIINA